MFRDFMKQMFKLIEGVAAVMRVVVRLGREVTVDEIEDAIEEALDEATRDINAQSGH